MFQNSENITGPVWACTNDKRITRVGRVLRKFHLDEIPQFFNVLIGDMSLVGPRPERPEIVANILQEIPDYLFQSLSIKMPLLKTPLWLIFLIYVTQSPYLFYFEH